MVSDGECWHRLARDAALSRLSVAVMVKRGLVDPACWRQSSTASSLRTAGDGVLVQETGAEVLAEIGNTAARSSPGLRLDCHLPALSHMNPESLRAASAVPRRLHLASIRLWAAQDCRWEVQEAGEERVSLWVRSLRRDFAATWTVGSVGGAAEVAQLFKSGLHIKAPIRHLTGVSSLWAWCFHHSKRTGEGPLELVVGIESYEYRRRAPGSPGWPAEARSSCTGSVRAGRGQNAAVPHVCSVEEAGEWLG